VFRVTLSVAPNPQIFSYRNYLADWQDWVRRDLVDEVVVQIYRQNLISMGFELSQISLSAVQSYVPVRISLLAGLRNQPKSIDQLRQEIELVQRQGFASVDLFFMNQRVIIFGTPAVHLPCQLQSHTHCQH
jgi:uncharacterized lipoprotein YddW (UPF0748 family)